MASGVTLLHLSAGQEKVRVFVGVDCVPIDSVSASQSVTGCAACTTISFTIS